MQVGAAGNLGDVSENKEEGQGSTDDLGCSSRQTGARDSKQLEYASRVIYDGFPSSFCFGITQRSFSNFLACTVVFGTCRGEWQLLHVSPPIPAKHAALPSNTLLGILASIVVGLDSQTWLKTVCLGTSFQRSFSAATCTQALLLL